MFVCSFGYCIKVGVGCGDIGLIYGGGEGIGCGGVGCCCCVFEGVVDVVEFYWIEGVDLYVVFVCCLFW